MSLKNGPVIHVLNETNLCFGNVDKKGVDGVEDFVSRELSLIQKAKSMAEALAEWFSLVGLLVLTLTSGLLRACTVRERSCRRLGTPSRPPFHMPANFGRIICSVCPACP